jgi:hypothetical protein
MQEMKKHEQTTAPQRPRLAAMGLEAEFSLVVNDRPVRPEDVFGSPRDFVRGELMHRQGTSYHLPTGSAIYFDTGVIEIATTLIEIERGCAARAGRSLWESIRFTRSELDAWDAAQHVRSRLVGFSTHYNVSFDTAPDDAVQEMQGRTALDGATSHDTVARNTDALALILSYILPAPVMLLAANRQSTGIGVRPRPGRIEVTADFTPSAALMIATATLVVGVVREVMMWQRYTLDQLVAHDIPMIRGFAPVPHTSRRGWLARFSCYPANPFTCDIDEPIWQTERHGVLSLRDVAGRVIRQFWRSIRRISDPFTFRLIGSVIRGRSPSLLELPDRPQEYEDVGNLCTWDDLFPAEELARSRYERVLIRAISGQTLRLGRRRLRPIGMDGWAGSG